ncbi:MAG: hypothetical protein ACK4PR_11145 [Gammaproteobacteria bacterium]
MNVRRRPISYELIKSTQNIQLPVCTEMQDKYLTLLQKRAEILFR